MYLVHQKKAKDGKWEVAWMWLPHFLAQDQSLHLYVEKKMTETFKGRIVEGSTLVIQMHEEVIRLIMEKYPIHGLRLYLGATIHLDPEIQEKI